MDNKINCPFKFLDAYEWEDRKHFFGRDEEIDKLYEMVFEAPLLLVYGMSGTGKTSLVQCGLSSRFDGTDWFPFFVRRGDNLVASLQESLNRALPDDFDQSSSTPQKITKIYNDYLRPVYLIFDQFEELFILGEEEDRMQQQQEFAKLLRDLLDSELPCKVILIMREEFIAQLYSIEQEISSIYDHRLRVEPMGFPKISKVIKGSADAFNIELADAQIKSIYQNVSSGKFGVQLPYLQVYLDELYRSTFSRQYPSLTKLPSNYPNLLWSEEDVVGFGKMEDVLESFLEKQEKILERKIITIVSNANTEVVRKILNSFVTEEGTKRPLPFTRDVNDNIFINFKKMNPLNTVSRGLISFVVDELMSMRLLRERDGKIELAHDSLAIIINERRTNKERIIGDALRRIEDDFTHFVDDNVFLSNVKLLRYQQDLEGVLLRSDISDFISKSQLEISFAENESLVKSILAERINLRAELVLLNNVLLSLTMWGVFFFNLLLMTYFFADFIGGYVLFTVLFLALLLYCFVRFWLSMAASVIILLIGVWSKNKAVSVYEYMSKFDFVKNLNDYMLRRGNVMKRIEENLMVSVNKSDELLEQGYVRLSEDLMGIDSYIKSLPKYYILRSYRMSPALKVYKEEVSQKIVAFKKLY